MSKIKRILHPTDFSPASGAALARAVAMAKAERAELLIVHVMSLTFPLMGDGYVSPKVYEEMEASSRAYADKQLGRVLARARKAGVRARTLLLSGVPYEQIVRASRRADLVVMGTHGRAGLARFFLGSVAERVVTNARCPVLTVRGK
jgi:nucleotide-binding universal stress UspA family protein